MATVSSIKLSPTIDLRKLPIKETNKLIDILNRNKCWKELAAVITHPDNPDELFFSSDQISVLEDQWKCDRSPGEALFHHWSTSGKKPPNIIDLINFLKTAELFRAVTDVEKLILKENGTSYSMQEDGNDRSCQEFKRIDLIVDTLANIDLENSELTLFSYEDLQVATRNFCNKSPSDGGCKIGEGGYGYVYKADMLNTSVAVKVLKDTIDQQFVTELNILSKFKHKNLLQLIGFSLNGPTCCLVYEFMSNGSLQDRLACKDHSVPIPWETRLDIAYGSALGINHLHTYGEKPMVHRDIKSANILLDEYFVPKVGDFGLVRLGAPNTSTIEVTKNIYGTSVYMAREAFYGDVSVKLDSFSFGVVLLELITGLPPFDTTREDCDLVTHVENCDNIVSIFDQTINWPHEPATELFRIAKLCLTDKKKERPTILQILEDLKNRCNMLT